MFAEYGNINGETVRTISENLRIRTDGVKWFQKSYKIVKRLKHLAVGL